MEMVLPLPDLHAFLDAAAIEARDPDLGLHLAERTRVVGTRAIEWDAGKRSATRSPRRRRRSRRSRGRGRPLGEIAYLLGYAELSPFLRAFRRWTGRTAAEWRAESTELAR